RDPGRRRRGRARAEPGLGADPVVAERNRLYGATRNDVAAGRHAHATGRMGDCQTQGRRGVSANLYDLPEEILVRADGGVRIITLNRPDDRNPASTAMLFALTELAQKLNADEDARAVVITGAGKAFSAGGDFQHFVRSSR